MRLVDTDYIFEVEAVKRFTVMRFAYTWVSYPSTYTIQ